MLSEDLCLSEDKRGGDWGSREERGGSGTEHCVCMICI